MEKDPKNVNFYGSIKVIKLCLQVDSIEKVIMFQN